MAHEFTVSATIPATAKQACYAWLGDAGHAGMTGGAAAKVSAKVGGAFTAWDGYIEGKNLILEPARRIVQSWRTTEFAESDEDSEIDVLLETVAGGTRITLHHSKIPDGHTSYREGWKTCYFEPMKAYFTRIAKPA